MADKSTAHTRPKGYNDLADIAASKARAVSGDLRPGEKRARRYPWEPTTDRAAQRVAKHSRKINR